MQAETAQFARYPQDWNFVEWEAVEAVSLKREAVGRESDYKSYKYNLINHIPRHHQLPFYAWVVLMSRDIRSISELVVGEGFG